MDTILQNHLSLCDCVYAMILEENQILKATNAAPEESFLSRKRELIPALEESIRNLRILNESGARNERFRGLVEKAQRIVMKTLLLDRENEQLLLKPALAASRPSGTIAPSLNHLQRLYQKHAR